MKILFISSDNNKTSGAFLCLVELNRYLREVYNVDTFVIIPKQGDGVQLLDKYHIPYKIIPSYSWITYNGYSIKALAKTCFKLLMMLYNYIAIKKIQTIIKKGKFDFVHTNTIFSYVGAKAAFLEHTKHIWHLRECINEGHNSRIVVGESGYKFISKSNIVLAVSQTVRQTYQNDIDAGKIKVVYDGVSANLYKKKNIFKDEVVQFTCIGGFIDNKNQIELINACDILKKSGQRNFHLNLVGRGPMELNLRAEVNRLGLNDYVTFSGVFDRVQDILEKTDIVCVVSKSEAFGRTVIEGMLQGCLIIGANTLNSAIHELITDGITGFLYPCGDLDRLAHIMNACLQKDNQRHLQKVAIKGQEVALQKYTTLSNAENIMNVYKTLMQK
ncbi:glycosyltransferase family 4 protein [Mitsuokella multacida]|uniref:glycosyltransferase family 4 protein n=1 Tax=Mitsuokella multacida TaxID=52226 RepID=UPI0039F4824D